MDEFSSVKPVCGNRNGDNVCNQEPDHTGKHMQSLKGGTMVWGLYNQGPENGRKEE